MQFFRNIKNKVTSIGRATFLSIYTTILNAYIMVRHPFTWRERIQYQHVGNDENPTLTTPNNNENNLPESNETVQEAQNVENAEEQEKKENEVKATIHL